MSIQTTHRETHASYLSNDRHYVLVVRLSKWEIYVYSLSL